jgi:hypothetical protein
MTEIFIELNNDVTVGALIEALQQFDSSHKLHVGAEYTDDKAGIMLNWHSAYEPRDERDARLLEQVKDTVFMIIWQLC